MAIPPDSIGSESPQVDLTDDEARLVKAIVEVMKPHFDAMNERFSEVDRQLAAINALVLANHEDVSSLQNQLITFQEESTRILTAYGEVSKRLDADVTYLMDR